MRQDPGPRESRVNPNWSARRLGAISAVQNQAQVGRPRAAEPGSLRVGDAPWSHGGIPGAPSARFQGLSDLIRVGGWDRGLDRADLSASGAAGDQ